MAIGTSRAVYLQSQTAADVERRLWDWSSERATGLYSPIVEGKWWSAGSPAMSSRLQAQRDNSHIGRIMETELGQQLHGDERCTACIELSQECWVYSAEGLQQVSKAGSTCARCRAQARTGGCSLAKRKKEKPRRRGSPIAHPPRFLRPKDPPPPPPSAGGDPIII